MPRFPVCKLPAFPKITVDKAESFIRFEDLYEGIVLRKVTNSTPGSGRSAENIA